MRCIVVEAQRVGKILRGLMGPAELGRQPGVAGIGIDGLAAGRDRRRG